ncbi:glucosaminidase domain-containing protein [Vreelandella utahensis]|uniref:glucosaminidase domain-containing protein n=1 Tax=Vreelandella halophila TaxID=86177 RepID=UPI0015C33EAF|nr:glucosaminidase domain-containing protein [Halomonas utahensis]
MLSQKGRQCLWAAIMVGYVIALSACDNGVEESEVQESQEATTPESEQVAIPPRIDEGGGAQSMPAFLDIPAGPERKEAFFDYLAPVVRDINTEVEKRREALFALEEQLEAGEAPGQEAEEWLLRMTERYRVDAGEPAQQVQALKRRIDIIPVSLALAQGALESAWGTSRFARQGRNIFGKWCFTEGCGIVPAQRRADATHEVASYDNVADAVRDYMHHLNSHPVYEPLRERRAQARAKGRSPEGADLAAGLEKYSAKGEGYIMLIRRVISANDLGQREGPEEQDA